jgi:hypothetical protein
MNTKSLMQRLEILERAVASQSRKCLIVIGCPGEDMKTAEARARRESGTRGFKDFDVLIRIV